MKKLKLFAIATSLLGMSFVGVSFLGSQEVDAQSSGYDVCDYIDGKGCKTPQKTNTCPCEGSITQF